VVPRGSGAGSGGGVTGCSRKVNPFERARRFRNRAFRSFSGRGFGFTDGGRFFGVSRGGGCEDFFTNSGVKAGAVGPHPPGIFSLGNAVWKQRGTRPRGRGLLNGGRGGLGGGGAGGKLSDPEEIHGNLGRQRPQPSSTGGGDRKPATGTSGAGGRNGGSPGMGADKWGGRTPVAKRPPRPPTAGMPYDGGGGAGGTGGVRGQPKGRGGESPLACGAWNWSPIPPIMGPPQGGTKPKAPPAAGKVVGLNPLTKMPRAKGAVFRLEQVVQGKLVWGPVSHNARGRAVFPFGPRAMGQASQGARTGGTGFDGEPAPLARILPGGSDLRHSFVAGHSLHSSHSANTGGIPRGGGARGSAAGGPGDFGPHRPRAPGGGRQRLDRSGMGRRGPQFPGGPHGGALVGL